MTRKTFIVLFILLSAYFCLFGVQKINLTTADIGRHVKNGELTLRYFFDGNRAQSYALLHTNFYSYTNASFPFINHHWASGVLAYLIFAVSGWNGLSVIYILLMLGAFYFALRTAQDGSPPWLWIPAAILLIPLMADRAEVRPEAVSYLFILLFIFLLSRYKNGMLKEKYLWSIPLVIFVWANLHIYFIFGFFVLGAFGLEELIKQNWIHFKKLVLVSVASIAAACVNPYGPYLLYYPFVIFKNYGYLVAENQSIPFLQRLNIANPNYLWWDITAALVIAASLIALFRTIRGKKFLSAYPVALAVIAVTFGYLSFTAIRNFSIFGFTALPLIAIGFSIIIGNLPEKEGVKNIIFSWSTVISILIMIFSFNHFSSRLPTKTNWGIGLLPGTSGSADFVRTNGIKGPFFNNYDIGGYLIFSTNSDENPEQAFVDNRPEAYPANFFQNEYVPMQENETLWRQEEQRYDFNAIWFYRLDATPWAQRFLINRVNDTEWAPVFVDDYTIVLLKNTPQNSDIIKKYALPKSMFVVK